MKRLFCLAVLSARLSVAGLLGMVGQVVHAEEAIDILSDPTVLALVQSAPELDCNAFGTPIQLVGDGDLETMYLRFTIVKGCLAIPVQNNGRTPGPSQNRYCKKYCSGAKIGNRQSPALNMVAEALFDKSAKHPGCNQKISDNLMCEILPGCTPGTSYVGLYPTVSFYELESSACIGVQGEDLQCACEYWVSGHYDVTVTHSCSSCPKE